MNKKIINKIMVLACYLFIANICLADDVCTITGNGIQVNTESPDYQGCFFTPEKISVNVKKIYLCKTAPTIPSDFSQIVVPNDCETVVDKSDGAYVAMGVGENVSFGGVLPPHGTYGYVVFIMGNRWGIQAGFAIDDINSNSTGVYGKTSHGNHCWTLSGELSEAAIDSDESFGINPSNWLVDCGSSAGSPGMPYTILDNAADVDGEGHSSFDTIYNGVRITGAYTDATFTKKPTRGNDRIFIVNDYSSSPIVVNESTTKLDIVLPVTNAASTQLYNGTNMAHIGAGVPFLYIRSR